MRKYIKYIRLVLIFTAVLLSIFTFLATRDEHSRVFAAAAIVPLFMVLPIFMQYRYRKINNHKQLYSTVMIILYLILFTFILLCIINSCCTTVTFFDGEEYQSSFDLYMALDNLTIMFKYLLFMCSSWLILLINLNNIDKDDSKTNTILIIVVSLIVILIHLNYYANSNLHIALENAEDKISYITQNYIYIGFIYILIIYNEFRENNKVLVKQ